MPDEFVSDAGAESLAADPSSQPAADPSAGTQNTGVPQPAPAPEVPFHQHPRWQQVMRERNAERQQNQVLSQQVQQLQQRLQGLESSRPPDAAPSREHREAAEALLQIMQAHPQLKTLLGLAQAGPRLVQGYQGLAQQQQQALAQQSRALVDSGHRQIADAVTKAGLPSDPGFLARMNRYVAAEIHEMDGGAERLRSGDLSVVAEATKAVIDDFISGLRRQGVVALNETKNATKRLPPAPVGGHAGPPAPQGPQPGQERKYATDMHRKAMELLQG